MTRPMVRIHDLATNEIIDREMNDDELVQFEIDKQQQIKRQENEAAQLAAKTALLQRLGISEEEAKLLLS